MRNFGFDPLWVWHTTFIIGITLKTCRAWLWPVGVSYLDVDVCVYTLISCVHIFRIGIRVSHDVSSMLNLHSICVAIVYILYATLHWCILISKARTFAAFPIFILFLMQPFLFAPLWNSMLFICFHSVENQKEKNTRFVSRSVSFYRSLSMTDRFYGERSES